MEMEGWKAAGVEERSRAALHAPSHPDLGLELLRPFSYLLYVSAIAAIFCMFMGQIWFVWPF